MRKWLNMGTNESDYSADPDDDEDLESDSDNEGDSLYTTMLLLLAF